MSFFDSLRKLVSELGGETNTKAPATRFSATDRHLCAAALMVHIIMADGIVRPEESAKLHSILTLHYGLSEEEATLLTTEAKSADAEAVDLYSFTSILKREMDEIERIALVEDLWEMVYADGELHEFEDNIVWRVAELIAVSTRDRMEMKKRVQQRREAE